MDVPDTEEAIRAALMAAGVKPMICQEKGKRDKTEITENKRRLQKVADAQGRKLVFITPGVTMDMVVESLAELDKKTEAPIGKEDGHKEAQGLKAQPTKIKKAPAKKKDTKAQPEGGSGEHGGA